MIGELILTGDTYDVGRIALNNQFSATAVFNNSVSIGNLSGNTIFSGANELNFVFDGAFVWSASTGTKSIVARNASGIIASGNYAIAGGSGSTASGNYSFIGGGQFHLASSPYSFIGGGSGNTVSGIYSAIVGGKKNLVSSVSSFIGGGTGNTAGGIISFVGGGFQNQTFSNFSIIGGGGTNNINAGSNYSAIFGGSSNNIDPSSHYSFIGGGSGGNILASSNNSSLVGGQGNTVDGPYSFMGGGNGNTVTGNYSFIGGGNGNTIFSSNNSFIGGGSNNESFYAHSVIVGGQGNNNLGIYSSIIGGSTNSIDSYSSHSFIGGGLGNYMTSTLSTPYCFIGGGQTNSIADGSHSFIGGGYTNKVTANFGSVPGGQGNEAAHTHATAMGGGAQTRANFDIVLGATATNTPSTANNTIRLQGTGGNVRIDGAVSSPEADYAEFFQFFDENINGEDRKGLFVSLFDDKIKVGGENPIGIVSVKPTVVGDSSPNHWNQMYLKDEWGVNIKESYSSYTVNKKTVYVDSSGNKFLEYPNPSNPTGITFTGKIAGNVLSIEDLPKMNPSYDKNIPYIPREERQEWAPVGLLGKLMVRTAENITGKTISPNSEGYAVNGNKYPVLKTIRMYQSPYGIVQVLFR